jgi:GTP-binding protein Era
VGFRSGFIALVGRPNVGKSTLLNRILGEKIAIVSDKPQTTRHQILGVRNLPTAQLVFLDTPGIHKPLHHLNRRMVDVAMTAMQQVDVLAFLVEAMGLPGGGDQYILDILRGIKRPTFLVVNKVDLVQKGRLLPLITDYTQRCPFTEVFPISALSGENVESLVGSLAGYLPEGERLFPEEVITDQPMRFLACELIREQVLKRTREEIPYSVAVLIESFDEETERNLVRIRAVIFVERKSQKGIIIGKGGGMLKTIGREARLELEGLLGVKVFLELWVKVKENWREDERVLQQFGY